MLDIIFSVHEGRVLQQSSSIILTMRSRKGPSPAVCGRFTEYWKLRYQRSGRICTIVHEYDLINCRIEWKIAVDHGQGGYIPLRNPATLD